MSAAVRAGYKQTEVGVIPGDWEVQRIGDLATVRSGGTPSREIKAYWNGAIPWITTSQIDFNTISEADQFITEDGLKNSAAKLLPAGTLLMALYGQGKTRGKVGALDFEAATNQACASINSHGNVSREFLLHFLTSRYEAIRNSSNSGGQENLSGQIVKDIPVAIPPIPEQRAIAATLSDVDALMAKLDQFIAKKRDLKQAAMQQLLTGQTRLPGFSGGWEVKRLHDIGDCLRGVTYKGDSDLRPHDTADTKRLLRSNNVQSATVVIADMQFVNADRVSGNQLLRANDILICMANGSKALVGKAGVFNVDDGYDYTFGAFMGCFRANTIESNLSFVFYLFQTGRYRNYINNLLAGSSINNLSPSSIESLEFQIPPMPEQTAIAAILSDMDAELAALEARRDKTRALKQGMMQELLTGRIRLVQTNTLPNLPNSRPDRDAMIAATALEHDMTVVTRNLTDFAGTGVQLINPLTS